MAKIPGLHLRGKAYYSRVKVPKALVRHFGRDQIWKSLETSDRGKAEVLHLQEATHWKAAFHQAYLGLPQADVTWLPLERVECWTCTNPLARECRPDLMLR